MYARITLTIGTIAAAAFFAGAAASAELRPTVTVAGETVTLGDIFDDAGTAAHVVVANAPAPGLKGEISVSRISLAARRNGIEWRNNAGLTHIVVGRSGASVPEEEIASAIAGAIEAQSSSLPSAAILQVDFANGAAGIQVAERRRTQRSRRTAFVQSMQRRVYRRRSRARKRHDDPLRRIAGRAYPVIDVPVLTRDVMPATSCAAPISTGFACPHARQPEYRHIATAACRHVAAQPRLAPESRSASPTCVRRSSSKRARRST